MDVKRLKKVLKEIKDALGFDYALHKGFCCTSCTNRILCEKYGDNSIGIWVKHFDGDQGEPPISELDKLYIEYDLGNDNVEYKKIEVFNILSKYYNVDWDYSDKKCILIKEKVESEKA